MMGAMATMGAMGGDAHAGHGMTEMPARAQHARTEYGANTDMRVDYPRTNLDDPGAGLIFSRARPRSAHSAGGRPPAPAPQPPQGQRRAPLLMWCLQYY